MEKPFSGASERNKDHILRVLRLALSDVTEVLEIGSGTGQHAVHFARNLPHLVWQPSDMAGNLPGMRFWFNEVELPNLRDPIELDVTELQWPAQNYSGVYSANTLHIMSKPEIESMFQGVSGAVKRGGVLCIYGPFKYGGKFTSESNEQFNDRLAGEYPMSGIRDVEWIVSLADLGGFTLAHDHEMPANNRLLQWRKNKSI